MTVVPSASNTAAYKLPFILEIKGKNRLSSLQSPDLPHSVEHVDPLLHGGHQFRCRIISYRHIMEIPGIPTAFFNYHIQEFITGDRFHIISGVTNRSPEYQSVCFQPIHGFHNPFEAAVSSSSVIRIFKALQTDGQRQITHPSHFLAECIVHQGTIGKSMEFTVIMLLAQTDNIILAHKRFAAGIHIQIYSQLLPLRDNAVQLFIA